MVRRPSTAGVDGPASRDQRGRKRDARVVFSAGLDGTLRAFSSFDGRPIWQYNTAKEFETVNGVKARGGSIGSAGATIVNGMVYVTSGYTGFQNGRPGNVLLAFGPVERRQ